MNISQCLIRIELITFLRPCKSYHFSIFNAVGGGRIFLIFRDLFLLVLKQVKIVLIIPADISASAGISMKPSSSTGI